MLDSVIPGASMSNPASTDHGGNSVSGWRVIKRFKMLELPQQALAKLMARASAKPDPMSAWLSE
jgi:hypothetical protein